MRLLFLIPSLSGGGAENQLRYLASELALKGHEVHIAYIYDGPSKPEMSDIHLNRFKTQFNYDPRLLCQLFRFVRIIKPEIILTWNPQMDILGGIVSRIRQIPWIIREPSSALLYSGTWKDRLRVLIGSGASAIVSNSIGGQEYWTSKIPSIRSLVIRNGLVLNGIDKVEAKLPPGINTVDVPILLFAGRFERSIKQPDLFLEVIARIKPEIKVLGIMCGEGQEMYELKELRHSLDLDNEIYFTGYLPSVQVWAIMKRASAFVSPSLFEGCPNTVMEAMVCGCPLVVSEIAAHREILDDDSALFFNPNDIQEMADRILKALNDRVSSKIRSINAKHKTLGWTVVEMARKYEQLYKDVIKLS